MYQLKIIASPEICYCSLALCILRNVTIEQAFDIINPLPESKQDKDERILQLRSQGLEWQEIGNMLGMSGNSVYHRAARYKDKCNNLGKN